MNKLKPCPFCGGCKIVSEEELNVTFCNGCSAETDIFDWNTRPIEDDLRARAEKAEAMVARLIEAGNWLNAMHEDGVFVDELNAARTSWKLAVSDWQSMPSHVTNPLESQGIVTRNGGEG